MIHICLMRCCTQRGAIQVCLISLLSGQFALQVHQDRLRSTLSQGGRCQAGDGLLLWLGREIQFWFAVRFFTSRNRLGTCEIHGDHHERWAVPAHRRLPAVKRSCTNLSRVLLFVEACRDRPRKIGYVAAEAETTYVASFGGRFRLADKAQPTRILELWRRRFRG